MGRPPALKTRLDVLRFRADQLATRFKILETFREGMPPEQVVQMKVDVKALERAVDACMELADETMEFWSESRERNKAASAAEVST